MCRWAAYRGLPIYLEDLVASPAHSLIEQSQCATKAKTATNGDGFGVAWYGARPEPGLYRDILPAWSDRNLRSLTHQISAPLFLAHVRASTAGGTSRENCHPFVHGRWSFMHNGQIGDYRLLRRPLENRLADRLYLSRHGSTDSELLFLLAVELGLADDPIGAMERAVCAVMDVAGTNGMAPHLRLTAAFSDGERLFAVRFATDAHAPTLYASPREASGGHCLVSEPFSDDAARWTEIPPGSAVRIDGDGLAVMPFMPGRRGTVRSLAKTGQDVRLLDEGSAPFRAPSTAANALSAS